LRSLALVVLLASRVALAQSAEPNMWRYDATIDGNASSVIAWEGGNDVFAGAPAFFIETVTISPNGENRIDERRYLQKTNSGVVLLGTRTATSIGGATSLDERVWVTPSVALPAALAVGSKWEALANLRIATTPAGGTAASSTANLHVVGEALATETITVPAGTFECIVVRDTSTTQRTQNGAATEVLVTTTSWYAAKVGLVKSTATTTDATKHESTRTLQLRAYQVPRPPWQMSSVGLVPAGEAAPSEPIPAAAPEELPPAQVGPPAETPVDQTAGKRRGLGKRLMIVGGAVLAGGLVLGALASSQWSAAQDDCGGDVKKCTSQQIGDARIDTDAARSYARFSTGFTVAGAVVIGTGAYLYFSNREKPKTIARLQPSVTPSSATLVLTGSW
jgi:hypothetical protein